MDSNLKKQLEIYQKKDLETKQKKVNKSHQTTNTQKTYKKSKNKI